MAYNRAKPTTRGPFPREINRGDPLAHLLVQSWPLNETGTGTQFHNAANPTRCTVVGTPVLDPSGPFGSAPAFSAGDWYVNAGTIPQNPTPQLGLWPTSGDWSVSYWMKSSTITGGTRICLSLDDDYWWGFNATGLVALGLNGTGYTGTINIADGIWHHLVFTVRAAVLNVFVDGRLDIDVAANKPLNLGTAVEFGRYPSAGFNFTGSLAGVNVWSRALLQEEARQLYAEPWRIYVAPRRRMTKAATTTVAAGAQLSRGPSSGPPGLRFPATRNYEAPAALGTVTATLNATLDAPTFTGAATVAVAATLAATTPALTFSAAATVEVAATLAATTQAPAFAGTATIAVSATLAATTPEPTFAGTATVAVSATLDATTDPPTFSGTVDAGAPVSASVGGGPARRRRTANTEPLGNRSHTTPRRNSRQGVAEEEMAETLEALRPGAQIRVMPNDDENDDEEAILWLIH